MISILCISIALVYVNPRHRLPLTLLSIIQSSREQYKWNIKISQLKCDDVKIIKGLKGNLQRKAKWLLCNADEFTRFFCKIDAPNCGRKFVAKSEEENETVPTTTMSPEELEPVSFGEDGFMEISRAAVDTAFYIGNVIKRRKMYWQYFKMHYECYFWYEMYFN